MLPHLIFIAHRFVLFFLFFSYFWMAGNSKLIHLLHNSEHPTSVFSILDTGTKHIPLVADSLFDLLILKMQPAYTSKKQTKVRKIFQHTRKSNCDSPRNENENSNFCEFVYLKANILIYLNSQLFFGVPFEHGMRVMLGRPCNIQTQIPCISN